MLSVSGFHEDLERDTVRIFDIYDIIEVLLIHY